MSEENIRRHFNLFAQGIEDGDEETVEQTIRDFDMEYCKLSVEERYKRMLIAHSTLFGGTVEKIDKDVETLSHSSDISENLDYLTSAMRESLTHTQESDHVLSHTYDMIGAYEENENYIWESLFAAAAHYKHRQALDNYIEDFHARSMDAINSQNLHQIAALEDEEENFINRLSTEDRYYFQLKIMSLSSGEDKDSLDRKYAMASKSDETAVKLKKIEDDINADDPYGSLPEEPRQERRPLPRINHPGVNRPQ